HADFQIALEQQICRIPRLEIQANKIALVIKNRIGNVIPIKQLSVVSNRTEKLSIQQKDAFVVHINLLKNIVHKGLYIGVIDITLIQFSFQVGMHDFLKLGRISLPIYACVTLLLINGQQRLSRHTERIHITQQRVKPQRIAAQSNLGVNDAEL